MDKKGKDFFLFLRTPAQVYERASFASEAEEEEDGWCLSNKNIGIQGGRGGEGMEERGDPPPLNEKRGKGMRIVPLIKQKA